LGKVAIRKKKTPQEILDRFADDVIQMNSPSTKVRGISSNSSSKAVVGKKDKDRSTTPSRGIFGRGNNNNNNAITTMAVTTNRNA
jgi:hypothetical protein